MKILFSADEHLYLRKKNVDKTKEKRRFTLLFEELNRLENEVDLTIHGGDFFDRVPTLEELSMFFEYVRSKTKPTIIFDGNHEAMSGDKSQTFLSLLSSTVKSINPLVEIVDTIKTHEYFQIVPYRKLKSIENVSAEKPLLFTHVRGDIPPHVKSEIDLDLLANWELVVAGDLHFHHEQKNIVYPGGPFNHSFKKHTSKNTSGFLIVDAKKTTWKHIPSTLPQLIKVPYKLKGTFEEKDNIVVYEAEGSLDEMSGIAKEDNVIKKIKKSDDQLLLTADMTLYQEIEAYSRSVLNLKDSTIVELLNNLKN